MGKFLRGINASPLTAGTVDVPPLASLAGLPNEVLVCGEGQRGAREVGLARHEHLVDAAGAAAAVRG
jgi:hypothetical protein